LTILNPIVNLLARVGITHMNLEASGGGQRGYAPKLEGRRLPTFYMLKRKDVRS